MKFNIKNLFKRKPKRANDQTVKNYVESFFEPIRYSKDVVGAKNRIIETLTPVYDSMKAQDENAAFGNFVAEYPNLGALLASAGIDRAKADEWRERKAGGDCTAEFARAAIRARCGKQYKRSF